MFGVSKLDLDLEQICLLCAKVLFSAGFGLVILLAIPQSYPALHLGFWHFVLSLILLSASGIFVTIRQLYIWFWSWPSDSYCSERRLNFYKSTSTENFTVKDQTTATPEKLQRHKLQVVDPPSREELQRLKELLGISEGSLQFKRRGFGVYHVVYSEGKHNWNHLGTWKKLKQKLDF